MATSTGVITYGIEVGLDINGIDSLGNTIRPQSEIHRTLSTAPSTSDWSLVVTGRSGQVAYTDILPNDGFRRYYRVRHVLTGYNPSTWLGTIVAEPTEISET